MSSFGLARRTPITLVRVSGVPSTTFNPLPLIRSGSPSERSSAISPRLLSAGKSRASLAPSVRLARIRYRTVTTVANDGAGLQTPWGQDAHTRGPGTVSRSNDPAQPTP
jgi:hypothetical protein